MAAPPAQHTFPPDYLEQSRVANILVGNIILHVLSTVFVFARLYSRAVIQRSVYSDDYVLILAWLLGTCCNTIVYVQSRLGLGRHMEAVDPRNFTKLIFAGFLAVIFFVFTITVTKLSICISYLRILYFERKSRILLWATLVIIVVSGIVLGVYPFFQCTPTSAFWTRMSNTDPRCRDQRPPFYANTAFNILTDIALIWIVIPPVLQLTLPRRQKIALLAVISLGGLTIIADIIRTHRSSRLLRGDIDPIWSGYDQSLWIALEIHIGLFCASAPTIKPLLGRLAPGLLGTNASSKRKASYHGAVKGAPQSSGVMSEQDDVGHIVGHDDSWIELDGELQHQSPRGQGPVTSHSEV